MVPDMANPIPILTVEDVARVLGLGVSAVRKHLVGDDPIPSKRLGALRRVVLPNDLRAWADRREMMLVLDPDDVARPWPREVA